MSVWNIVATDEYRNHHAKYRKNRRIELAAVLGNLDQLLQVLNAVGTPERVSCKFFRSEGKGLFRISESGGAGNPRPTRLYVTLKVKDGVIYLLAIKEKGAKRRQSADIKRLQEVARDINAT